MREIFLHAKESWAAELQIEPAFETTCPVRRARGRNAPVAFNERGFKKFKERRIHAASRSEFMETWEVLLNTKDAAG